MNVSKQSRKNIIEAPWDQTELPVSSGRKAPVFIMEDKMIVQNNS